MLFFFRSHHLTVPKQIFRKVLRKSALPEKLTFINDIEHFCVLLKLFIPFLYFQYLLFSFRHHIVDMQKAEFFMSLPVFTGTQASHVSQVPDTLVRGWGSKIPPTVSKEQIQDHLMNWCVQVYVAQVYAAQ